MEEKTVVKIEKETNSWLEKAKAIKITNQESLIVADTLAKDIKRHRVNVVEKELRPNKEAATKVWKAANALWNKYVNPLEAAEKAIKDEMIVYDREQERIRRAAEEEARKEAEELARLEREKVEKEAEELAAADKTEEFEEKAAQAEQISAEDHMPVFQPAPPSPEGTIVKDKWKVEVTDLWELIQAVAKDKKLINALKADEIYLGQRARSDKGSLKIPGVRVYNEGSISMRT